MGREENIDNLPPYFLGSIVLIKGSEPKSEIIDGQQRLTTLTILLSVLRSLADTRYVRALTTYLYQEADLIANTPNRYRLQLRQRDAYFFQEYIQNEGGIEKLVALETSVLPDSQKNIRDNALIFLQKLKGFSASHRILLAQTIINRCFLVVVSTTSFDSAYRIFSVLNDRGLNLSHSDILKAQMIGEIPEQEQTLYTNKWENIEVELRRETFQSLFAHIRMIYRKAKPQDTVLKEFRDYVWPTRDTQQALKAKEFIDRVLIPFANAFSDIKDMDYESTNGAEKVNNILGWLNKIDNSDWLPSAILYYSRNKLDQDKLLHFFSDLVRLAAGMMILRANVNQRIDRYASLLTAIENNDDLYASGSPLQLTKQEQKDIITALNGDLYGWGHCKYVLLRLNEALSTGGVKTDYTIFSIEHVLPQTPKSNSQWLTWFPDEVEREKYVHQLGNLVPLGRKKNSEAQNYDFAIKKEKYFKLKTGVSPFPLTTLVINETEWTPLVIERRQQALVNTLKDIWRLN